MAFDVDGNGTVEGSEKNTIEVTIDLDSNATYAFELAKGAVTDLNGNANAEAITFNVTSGTFQSVNKFKVTGTFRIVDMLWINALRIEVLQRVFLLSE